MARIGTVVAALAVVSFGLVVAYDVCMPYLTSHRPVQAAAGASPAVPFTATAAAAPGKSRSVRAGDVLC